MSEMKPCPFCGGEVRIWDTLLDKPVVRVIECEKCRVRFLFAWGNTVTGKDLYDAWNRRRNDE